MSHAIRYLSIHSKQLRETSIVAVQWLQHNNATGSKVIEGFNHECAKYLLVHEGIPGKLETGEEVVR